MSRRERRLTAALLAMFTGNICIRSYELIAGVSRNVEVSLDLVAAIACAVALILMVPLYKMERARRAARHPLSSA
jgi:hypothetical protein